MISSAGCCAGSLIDLYEASFAIFFGGMDVDIRQMAEDECGTIPDACVAGGDSITVYRTSWAVDCVSNSFLSACARDDACGAGAAYAFAMDVEMSSDLLASEVFVSGFSATDTGVSIDFYVVPTSRMSEDEYIAAATANEAATFDYTNAMLTDMNGYISGCNVYGGMAEFTSPGISMSDITDVAALIDAEIAGTSIQTAYCDDNDVCDETIDMVTVATLTADGTSDAHALVDLNTTSFEMYFTGASVMLHQEASINVEASSAVTVDEITTDEFNAITVENAFDNAVSPASAVTYNKLFLFVVLFVMAILF
jgi:hypothetical protein